MGWSIKARLAPVCSLRLHSIKSERFRVYAEVQSTYNKMLIERRLTILCAFESQGVEGARSTRSHVDLSARATFASLFLLHRDDYYSMTASQLSEYDGQLAPFVATHEM